MRKSLIVAAVVALAWASTAFAGGWATVKPSSSPKGLTADEPWVVDITVLQHGLASQPLCCLRPTVTIRRVASGRSTSAIRKKPMAFRARPTSRTGVYRARVVFPSAGTWRYEVFDAFTEYGGARTHRFAPVKILAPSTRGPRRRCLPRARPRRRGARRGLSECRGWRRRSRKLGERPEPDALDGLRDLALLGAGQLLRCRRPRPELSFAAL